jgi:pectin methylesterase-like acyl-CoA thioesterase
MTHIYHYMTLCLPAMVGVYALPATAATTFNDPPSVVEQWSNASTSPKVIDINFTDATWPNTWGDFGSAMQCPEYTSGLYVNATLTTPVVGADDVNYPVLFHNCTFATKESYNGYAAATSAFARQYYEGSKACNYNDWKQTGHTYYLEDNIEYDATGKPTKGEAGFVQMCRNASTDGATSLHGWMEIDHLPYVERVQWSWSSTSWGRGIKCDVKIGDGDWTPLVWMGSEKQKQFYTTFSDQGYFMENVIDAHDVSLRWRIWDGDANFGDDAQVQITSSGINWQAIDPLAQRQATRVHKVQIFGDMITTEQADYARANPVNDIGEPSDLSSFGYTSGSESTTPAPDATAPVSLYYVNPDGTGDYTTIQAAINAVPDGSRGIIYIAPGVYEENLYAGTKESHNKFISLIGADAATTILTSAVDRGSNHSGNTYLDCAALNVFTDRFYAENLTVRNTSGNVGQAEALYTNADAHIFKNCILSGYQDTYKANVGSRGYFTGCTISGATDFIYDGGLEWFEDCKIVCVPGGGYITAPAEASLTLAKTFYPELQSDLFHAGLFFNNCDITAESGVAAGTYYLGRPWKENSGAMFMRCRLATHINALGWKDWSGAESSASLYEYKNIDATGALIATDGRASFSHQATDGEVEAYLTPEFLFAKASKVEFDYATILRGAAAPSNFVVTPESFSWESDDQAVGYIIYRNGAFEALSTETTYALPEGTVATDYSVASVSRHGVTSATVRVADAQRILAFPTAEGFGKFATGGRGGRVVTVTKLTDDGSEGTLRWAFQQYSNEPITIVFAVSGQIALASELRVNRSNWTLAGQTAPGEGIAITRNKVNLGGSQNFIVRNMRFRIGQKNLAGEIQAENALGAENCSNFIFDHCSFGWSVEENMNTADSHFLTVQYSIVHEGLYNAGHSKGARGYGSQWGGSPATYHHNLLAHNNSRSARLNGARGEDYVVFMEYVNNVNYNYGSRGGCYGGENTAAISAYNGLNSAHECNFMNNYYKPGPNSNTGSVTFIKASYARSGATSWAPAKWYVAGNVAEGFAAATADNWQAVEVETYTLSQIKATERIVTQTPWYRYTVNAIGSYVPEQYMLYNIESATDAYHTVVAKAGTVHRDAVEQRVADEAANGTTHYAGSLAKGIIDTESEAEGFYDYSTDYVTPTDTDGDGMPDDWETAHGLDPAVADNNLLNADGYTALEVYLNELMGEEQDTHFSTTGLNAVLTPTSATYDAAAQVLTVAPAAIGAQLEVYATDGRLLSTRRINATQTSLKELPAGILLLRISAPTLAPSVQKVKR